MRILGVTIDNLTRQEILTRIRLFLDEPRFHQIATINPEFLLEAEKNKDFHTVLEGADLRIADGIGIVWAGLLQSKRMTRFAGADLLEEILKIANEKKLSIYLAIKKDGLSSFEEVKNILSKKYPNLTIHGQDIDTRIPNSIFKIQDSIILCNFGAPSQELFLASLRNQNSDIRVAMGVGGALDYLAGKQKRAPYGLRVLGLEWLWRFIQQPKRWRRIWNAAIVFPFRVLFATIRK